MKRRRMFTRSQVFFLWTILTLLLSVSGSLFLSRCGNTPVPVAGISERGTSYYAVPALEPEVFPFDPNEADSTMLLRLGLAPSQVRSIYRYRAKGGRFSTPDDFRRVYRLTNEQWERLSPCIRIAVRYRYVAMPSSGDPRLSTPKKLSGSSRNAEYTDTVSPHPATDTVSVAMPVPPRSRGEYPVKLSGDELLDVNVADSAALCRVPGIGPYFSRKIIQYRRRLGGYATTEQLLQIDDFPADAIAWLVVSDTVPPQRLSVNTLSTRKLMKHPYMGYYRASAIETYRRIHGSIRSIEVLRGLEHFTDEDLRRLEPYLDFD
ncbi:MAG: helix-hairpin-helix domain-containing protein [Bacteroidaceae bacterium]|nr:helix-hairpin-helix domain-containing protein [Bacteroidaceae bacterium]